MELGLKSSLERMNLVEARPQHDTFGISNAMLIAPGHPENSVLFQRLSRRGKGQMPPLVSNVVDEKAVALFREWISGLSSQQQFVKDWKTADLLPALDQLKKGRSFDSGQDAFRQAGCVQCHRFAGSGGTVGPNLEGVSRRLGARDILESILLPSNVITEGYASTELETSSGDSLTGFIEREDDQVIVLRPVLATEAPISVSKKEITRRSLSKFSNMPAGIANSLTEAQILDLIAYLIADGKESDPAFSKGEAH